jgi:hypothetical protein
LITISWRFFALSIAAEVSSILATARKQPFFLSVSVYVCPEPVLVKRSSFSTKRRSQKQAFFPTNARELVLGLGEHADARELDLVVRLVKDDLDQPRVTEALLRRVV